MKYFIRTLLCILFLVTILTACQNPSSKSGDASHEAKSNISADSSEKSVSENSSAPEKIRVADLDFSRISDTEIRLLWSDKLDPYVKSYSIRRRDDETGKWNTLSTFASDGTRDGNTLSYTDVLDSSGIRQYAYCVEVTVSDPQTFTAGHGKIIYASNLLICIDPGHFAGRNSIDDAEGYSYSEGDFTLELAAKLKDILKSRYGVDSYLTRESGDITIGGYTNAMLDQMHISLRGEAAAGSTLFLSIHTNANNDMANGYPTWQQPVAINKPVIIANTKALDSDYALQTANAVGTHLAETSCELGIASVGTFRTVNEKSEAIAWSDSYNDRLDTAGTICYRLDGDEDYYGVLRGAASVGVPGLIIEHGFHTVPEMRKQANENELSTKWAEADAQGIADGFGLKYEEE